MNKNDDGGAVGDNLHAPSDSASGNSPVPEIDDAVAAELKRLRHQIVTQSAELAVVRWEIASLLRQQAILDSVTQFKHFFRGRYPRHAQRAARLKRATVQLMASLRRARVRLPSLNQKINVGARCSLRKPILVADDSAAGEQIAKITPPNDLISVSPGAGFTKSLPVSPDGEPTLRLPARGSLAEWLIDDASRMRKLGTVVVNSSDEVSLSLLRGRLTASQNLVLTQLSDTTSSIVAELGPPTVHENGMAYYASIPDIWLDPLDSHGRPDPGIVSGRSWPKISVVMVSFNQAAFLEEGLTSVLDQGYPNLEILVVDGKSTDGSIEILERYRKRLNYLLVEPDNGQSDGLNKGFARASGDILTWLNSDDLLEPGALFRVAQAFTAHKVDMVVGGCRQIGLSRGTVIRNHHTKLPFGIPVALPLGLLLEMERFWLTASFFYQPEVFFSRDIWNRSGGKLRVDLYYVLDYDLWVRMAAAGATIVHIPDFLACSRTHDQQKTTAGMPYLPEVQRLLQEYSTRLATPPL